MGAQYPTGCLAGRTWQNPEVQRFNGQLVSQCITDCSHHSPHPTPHCRSVPYRVTMAPSGLKDFLTTGGQFQLDRDTYKKTSGEQEPLRNTGTGTVGSRAMGSSTRAMEEGKHQDRVQWNRSSPSWGMEGQKKNHGI